MLFATITFVYVGNVPLFWSLPLRIINYTLLISGIALLIAAHSVTVYITAISVLLGTMALISIGRSGRMRFPTTLFLVWAIVIVAIVCVTNQTIIMGLGFLGRDPTLTSRTYVWDFAIQMIEARPLLGYGYGVFWDSYGGLLKVSHAHNGYISAALDVGLCGAILLVLLIMRAMWKSLSVVMSSLSFIATWPAAILIYLIVSNFAESRLFAHSSKQWCLLVVVSGILERSCQTRLVARIGSGLAERRSGARAGS